MIRIQVDIKDESKLEQVKTFLDELDFVEFRIEKKSEEDDSFMDEFFGIWQDRDISLDSIRKKIMEN